MIINKRLSQNPKRHWAIEIAVDELKKMLSTIIICNIIIIISCIVLCVFTASFEWQLFTGLAIGNASGILNFYSLGHKSATIIRGKNSKKARNFAAVLFLIRYLGTFIVFGLLITFNLINIITAVIPMFYPKIHYTIKAMFNKSIY